uniref:Chaperone protein DnaJ-like n=1 Tax=Nicotiana tabacum TaxID=4097 RepID=A0A1S4D8T9_TOBAC|nr:PREDICTED: chaperone protein DnaJ-like [Nicotiana tabacum]XP_016509624.1 PREDICTED: chaperone protein DnaJ-like [Nicotiana tabacum]XP_016509625.1 PREDICTED: chaperone protein DnaJ-like [Nicotiana tabacum]
MIGVPNNASFADLKKSYRLLVLKYHPDVSKDSGADEVFKKIRLAYEVLSNESTRNQYDCALQHQYDNNSLLGGDWDYNFEYSNGVRTYRWADSKRNWRRQRYWEQYYPRENFSFYYEMSMSWKKKSLMKKKEVLS